MREYIILGIIQGVVDWLPISSEGVLVMAQVWLFGDSISLTQMIDIALFLHIGSFLAVVIYFWRDVVKLFKTFFHYKSAPSSEKAFLNFLVVSSFFTAIVGYSLYRGLGAIDNSQIFLTGSIIMIGIGLLLLVTSGLQFLAKKAQNESDKDSTKLKLKDSVITGIVQGFSVLPGVSRSGSTISSLLLLKVRDSEALKISFFMGLPVVFGGNLILNYNMSFGLPQLVGVLCSLIFGLLTIHFLMKVAQKLSYAWFTLGFGLITIASGVISMLV